MHLKLLSTCDQCLNFFFFYIYISVSLFGDKSNSVEDAQLWEEGDRGANSMVTTNDVRTSALRKRNSNYRNHKKLCHIQNKINFAIILFPFASQCVNPPPPKPFFIFKSMNSIVVSSRFRKSTLSLNTCIVRQLFKRVISVFSSLL